MNLTKHQPKRYHIHFNLFGGYSIKKKHYLPMKTKENIERNTLKSIKYILRTCLSIDNKGPRHCSSSYSSQCCSHCRRRHRNSAHCSSCHQIRYLSNRREQLLKLLIHRFLLSTARQTHTYCTLPLISLVTKIIPEIQTGTINLLTRNFVLSIPVFVSVIKNLY